jgi:hypothetical protein
MSAMTAATVRGASGTGDAPASHPPDEVQVHVDYISADEPIHRKFAVTSALTEVKAWAQGVFVPNPPSDKTFYLSDDKTRHRFTAEEEARSLGELGYTHVAHLRLNEEQVSGNQ